ncbi:hypothetical protein NL676_034098 [Syzygium grande]|nr:hypothetical protein NL676_034098 [Syzygium grande]
MTLITNDKQMEVTRWKSHPWVGPRPAIHNPENSRIQAALQHVDSSDHRLARLVAVMASESLLGQTHMLARHSTYCTRWSLTRGRHIA